MSVDPLAVVGHTVGARYDVAEFLGAYGARAVYRAQHQAWAEPVRLELLAPSGGGDPQRAEQQRRAFTRASAIVAKLSSQWPSIAAPRDGGLQETARGPAAYVAYEWVDGPTLAEALANAGRAQFDADMVLDWFEPVLDALISAHREGVVHAHLDPHAFWVLGALGPRSTIKIDGLVEGAWRMGQQGGAPPLRMPVAGFAAPEVSAGDPTLLGPWTDVYGIAAVLATLICGGADAASRERGLPPGLMFAFDKALNPRIDARFKTMASFRASLLESAEGRGGDKSRNPRRTMVVADVQSELADGSAGGFETSSDEDLEVRAPKRGKARVRLAFTQPAIDVPEALREVELARQQARPATGPRPQVPAKGPSSGFIALLVGLLIVAIGGGVAVGYILFNS